MEGWLTSRYRLIGVVVLVLITGFATTNLINFSISKNAIRDSIISNELPLSSHTIFSEIQADLLKPIFVSSLMAQDTFLRDWVLEGEKTPAAIQRYLTEIRDRYSAFSSYFISDKTRNYYHFNGISRQIGTDDQWFWNAKKMRDPYEINLDYNKEQGGELTVYINYRVLDYDDNFIGVTGVGLGLDAVQELIDKYQQNFRRTIYFVNQGGQIQLRSNKGLHDAHSILEQDGIKSIAHQILSQSYGTFSYERDGEVMLLTSRYLPELKWYLLVELREREAVQKIEKSLMLNLSIGIVVVFAIIIVISGTLNRFQKQLDEMASTDKLSGLGNRQFFDMSLAQSLNQYRRNHTPFSVILLDIDNFKRINDNYGHSTGDQIIQQVSQIIGDNLRSSDTLCRWGGEEFAILAPECEREGARALADKIRKSVETSLPIPEHPELRITVSAGVTVVNRDDNAGLIFSRTDKALYRAKSTGRNRVETN